MTDSAMMYYDPYYDILYSPKIYLFNTTRAVLVRQLRDRPDTLLPTVRTYGWCKPCTTSTLAYQNITSAAARLYARLHREHGDNHVERMWRDMLIAVFDQLQLAGLLPERRPSRTTSPASTRTITDIQDYQELHRRLRVAEDHTGGHHNQAEDRELHEIRRHAGLRPERREQLVHPESWTTAPPAHINFFWWSADWSSPQSTCSTISSASSATWAPRS